MIIKMNLELSHTVALSPSPFLSCSNEGLTLETSAYNHIHGVKLIHINLRLIHYMCSPKTLT